MTTITTACLIALRLASTLVLLAFLGVIYWIFNEYDWNFPFYKLYCFTALFVAVAGFQFLRFRRDVPSTVLWAEVGMLAVILLGIFFVQFREYRIWLFEPPVSDIGYTTVHAVNLVVHQRENPYSRSDVNYLRKDLEPGYRGFHYGPMMIIGYLPVAVFPHAGYKITSLFYVLISVLLLIFLVISPEESWPERLAKILFVLTAYFLAKRFWIEILVEGANDIFHVMLILAALLALKKDRVFWVGVFTGLSFASKFSPALFMMPFMPYRQRNYWLGLGVGFLPFVPFLFWDYAGLWRNAFWLRVIIPSDHTSLYWLTPVEHRWIYGAILLTAYLIAVSWALFRKFEYASVLVGFTLLLIVADITQKQVHGNHLIWFYPLFAILFMGFRERLFGLISRPVGDSSV